MQPQLAHTSPAPTSSSSPAPTGLSCEPSPSTGLTKEPCYLACPSTASLLGDWGSPRLCMRAGTLSGGNTLGPESSSPVKWEPERA